MDLFPRSFLLVFLQFAVGGVFALSIPPFQLIDRGFYKSTAFVYVGIGFLALIGRIALLVGAPEAPSRLQLLEVVAWSGFVVCSSGYLLLLWGEAYVPRARFFTGALLCGVLTLVASALSYAPANSAIGFVIYPLAFVTFAFPLGMVSAGMLLGHWYLIDRDLSLEPFKQILAFYILSLVAETTLLIVGNLLLAIAGSDASRAALQLLWREHLPLLCTRLLVSPVGTGLLAWMIAKTLQIPQTMAATGLFYIAVLGVLVGEFLGRFILFRTGLPF